MPILDITMTKAQMEREIDRAICSLESALGRGDPVRICEKSRYLAGTVDYAWRLPEVWTVELLKKILGLFEQAVSQTEGTQSHSNIVPRVDEFKHRLTSLLVAKDALAQAKQR